MWCLDEPLPAIARGDGAHHNDVHPRQGADVQEPDRLPGRQRACLHEHQPRGLYRIRKVF